MAISTAATLLSAKTRETLEKAKYNTGYTNVPNSNKAVADSLPVMQQVAAELGFDLADTEHTFVVNKTADGKVFIYSPSIKSDKGVPCLSWGKLNLPLADIKVPMSIEEEGKRFVMNFELSNMDISFSLMLPKDHSFDKSALRRASRTGELGKLLVANFEKPKSMAELEPGEYSVIGYRENNYLGELKFNIQIDGLGWFKANSAVHQKLMSAPTITASTPAKMVVHEVTEMTPMGFPKVPVEFYTAAYEEIEVFDFT